MVWWKELYGCSLGLAYISLRCNIIHYLCGILERGGLGINGKGVALEKHLLIFGIVFKSPRDVNTAVMELLIMAYALKTSCARNIIGVIPYFPYSKQSKMRKRGSIVCKLLASMLAKAGECPREQQHGRLGAAGHPRGHLSFHSPL